MTSSIGMSDESSLIAWHNTYFVGGRIDHFVCWKIVKKPAFYNVLYKKVSFLKTKKLKKTKLSNITDLQLFADLVPK